MNATPRPAPAQRILCLWLPRLATDRLHRDRQTANAGSEPADAPASAGPLAAVETAGNAVRLACVDAAGLAMGLVPGMALADARAMCPGLAAVPCDPAADACLLRRLAAWCDRFTPLVAIDSCQPGLLLDITGCAHLFGGEAALACDLARRVSAQGLHVRVAIAGWPAAARALARAQHDARPRIVVPGGERAALHPLPLAVTGIDAVTLASLRRLGLRTIADVLDRPRAPLAARFGQGLADRLDELCGLRGEPVTPRKPPPAFMAERAFAEPMLLLEGLLDCVYRLLGHLAQSLERAGEGARVLRFSFYRVDGSLTLRTLATSRPNRDAAELCDLFARLIERDGKAIEAGFGIDLVRVAAIATGPLQPVQQSVVPADTRRAHGADEDAEVDRLIDRLGARFGRARVSRLAPVDSHVPEHAALRCAPHAVPGWSRETPARDAATPGLLLRPLRLFDRPEPVEVIANVPDGPPARFRWRRVLHDVAACEGPERIAAQWWTAPDDDPDAATRDYYRLQDAAGRRYWIFRQGLYAGTVPLAELAGLTEPATASQVPGPDRLPAPPRWFLHGIFA
ncbi:MAG: DNA polymerase Y family protein [Rhodobiaceae bacterium]|nr:DNA polymerase Y family protein [Rhodobiaceae bacterium]